jgi:hypothetical protein
LGGRHIRAQTIQVNVESQKVWLKIPESVQNTRKKGDVCVSASVKQKQRPLLVCKVSYLDILLISFFNVKVGKLSPISMDSRAGAAAAES